MEGRHTLTSKAADEAVQRSPPPAHGVWTAPSLPGLEFPGCAPRHLGRAELDSYEGRLEFWDADSETAWVCEPTTPYHERPSQALAAWAERIAQVRGSPIVCYGTMDLWLCDAGNNPRRILQADQSVYLHPLRARLPGAKAMVIGEHDFPDVVLEVDHTTDARRGKLKLYEAWRFPEVWIHVPDKPSASRPRGRLAGLTIYLLQGGSYRVSGASRAFPGWTAAEIHAALDETAVSTATIKVLERVGSVLGAREGTGPDDDPLLRSQRRQAFDQGRARAAHRIVRQILLSRGIEIPARFPANLPAFADCPEDAVVTAALECATAAEFEASIRR